MVTWPLSNVIDHERRVAAQKNLPAPVLAEPLDTPNLPGSTTAKAEARYDGGEARESTKNDGRVAVPFCHGLAAGKPLSWVVPGPPVPAPRMSQRDKWLRPPRPCVQAYWNYRDRIRRVVGHRPVAFQLTLRFWLPMPRSWSPEKVARLSGQPHRQRPDVSNLAKAVEDALFKEDSGIVVLHAEKAWTKGVGATEITITP